MIPKGTLITIGGNEKKEFTKVDERYQDDFGEGFILNNFITQAGGHNTRIEVITSASTIPETVGKRYRKTFKKLGAQNVGILDIRDRQQSEDTEVLNRIEEANGVMFSGGDQNQISLFIRNTPVHDLIIDRYHNEKDFVLAGTSAGAVVMAEDMIAGGKNSNTLRKNDLRMNKGLGILQDVIFDSHFIRRWRFGRLAEAVARFPDKLGIGLGEDTGLIITGGNCCEIIGSGMVILFDGSQLTHNSYDDLRDHVSISLANLMVHVLAPGDKYFISQKEPDIGYNPENHKKTLNEWQ